MKLDKNSPVPLYYQLAEWVREQIRVGALKPGERLPSERELSEQAGISRMTARQAVAYLVREGLIIVRQGVGTFVVEPKLTHDPLHLLGFSAEIIRQGGKPSSRVLVQTIVSPPQSVAVGLDLSAAERVVQIARLRLSHDTPLLLETVFVPAALCPGLESEDLAGRSLYELLTERYGLELTHTKQTIEATMANDYEAELFNVAPGTPMMLLEGVTYSASQHPVEYFKAIYRGDRFKFTVESHQGGAAHSEQTTVIHPMAIIPPE